MANVLLPFVFILVVLEFLVSLGTFVALVAENIQLNQLQGFPVRLNGTVTYAYAVSVLSTLATLLLVIGGIIRALPGIGRVLFVFFHPILISIAGVVFSVLWAVVAGLVYKHSLPIEYSCQLLRRLWGLPDDNGDDDDNNNNGSFGGTRFIEETVSSCHANKAFLVLGGLALAFWLLIMIASLLASCIGASPLSTVKKRLRRGTKQDQGATALAPASQQVPNPLPASSHATAPQQQYQQPHYGGYWNRGDTAATAASGLGRDIPMDGTNNHPRRPGSV
ncbi:hypothetical protein EV182_003239 [Spiromyces aspiralis]|uniref:Uncharacterized protein n=1 Tax=Spiromyces aspiralis TaxID=68401 RepID=A0ACC1HKK9_9FUNG|nr:hypothetical protein EV182_003239 [Spiromyces aspiralis]